MTLNPIAPSEINDMVVGLNRLARNLWWTWDQEAQDLFQELSPRGWRNMFHNAVAILHEVSDYELRVRLQDAAMARRVQKILQSFDRYLEAPDTWAAAHAPQFATHPVAYFSAEFGFHETLPIAAGGLGMLAGDHTKAASDLGLGFVGVSLFYREGYFMQAINPDNWQTEYYTLLNPKNLPIEPVLNARGEPLIGHVGVATSQVAFQAWRVNVGRASVYLLDTNLPENEPHYRDLTLRVYGGDATTRVMQEIVLGVGGVRLLRALGITPSVFHLNEGHAAFLVLELIRERMAEGMTFEAALAATRQQCLFTTHTPVEAGHDRFSPDLMHFAMHRLFRQIKVHQADLLGLGRLDPANEREPFCMTVLALKTARAANGVSELHGQVSRRMWQPLFPDRTAAEVPIGHVTNGVHLLGWMKGTVRTFWKRKLGCDWERNVNTPEFWQRILDPQFVTDEELWALRYTLRRELVEFTRRRLLLQGERLGRSDFIAFDHLLNVDALTIGFARRFATYKRAPLVFQQLAHIVELVKDPTRPIQFIFAGKAHPRDDDGKRFIQQIIHLSRYSELQGHLVFIENYDMHIARQMVAGCDVWLNNPRRPLEASGTSGMKTAPHGGLNLSILDGWWREAYDGTNGFAIGEDSHPDSIEEQDRRDGENLAQVLNEEVIPCFFNRDANGIPRQWIHKIRRAMATVAPQYNTWRMVQQYVTRYYLPQPQTRPAPSTADPIPASP
ncbi:MAG TPA: alpha-glucan family phosphorylase [Verrucomicrobiota bacterium]|nr:alpha-glucan family phosphorylase [Verrucomicrobiota bacterium]HNU51467.1 alpha-glucan family phosphorylase [Verrucomicrobiota bacterium]